MSDAPEERRRVYKKIAPLIMEYATTRVGRMFHAEDLYRSILDQNPDVAPDSPGRILRLLRRKGYLNYVIVDRGDSLYQFLEVADPEPDLFSKDDDGQAV